MTDSPTPTPAGPPQRPRRPGPFWPVFAICLLVTGPTCACLGFANLLAEVGRAFGPHWAGPSFVYQVTQVPLSGHHPGVVVANSVFWATCASLVVAGIWAAAARRLEFDEQEAQARESRPPDKGPKDGSPRE